MSWFLTMASFFLHLWLKRFWMPVPAKPSPSFFGKLLQGLHRCWTFLQMSPLDFLVHSQRHNGSLPKGQGKWTREGMGKDKAAPTSCRQHLVPSLAWVETPKTALALLHLPVSNGYLWKLLANAIDKTSQGFFCPDSVFYYCWKISHYFSFALKTLFFFLITPFWKHPQNSALGFRMNCSEIFTW